MNYLTLKRHGRTGLAVLLMTALNPIARADVVSDWNHKAGEVITEAKIGTPAAIRVMALVQTAVRDAVRSLSPHGAGQAAGGKPALDAAVAAANRAVLLQLLPAQQASISVAYRAALAQLPDGNAKETGITRGELAAAALFASRGDDRAATVVAYRPHTSAGAYVPTVTPAIPQWPQRRPWLLTHPAQLRPAPPPALGSDEWQRDYNEVRELGGKTTSRRSAEQTDVARFWEYSLPAIYFGVVRSVAQQGGRDTVRNAILYAAAAQAMDDAMIAVFEAKYHYNFWRPQTAIRNGDIDGHEATPRDAGWTPLIDAPMHPEYPSGHSILAATVGAVLRADQRGNDVVALSTSSPSAKGATRHWSRIDDFIREVSESRIHAGIHFRAATRAGETMGLAIGELAAMHVMGVAH